MRITKEEVEHVAKLARLKVTEDEKETYAGQLARVLEYMDKLKEVPTEDVAPTFHAVELKTPFREDVPGESLAPEETMSNAPEKDSDSFIVPRVI